MKEKRNLLMGIVLGALLGGVLAFLLFRQNTWLRAQAQSEARRFQQQVELTESVRNNGRVILMSRILDKADEELRNNPQRTLSDETIARIIALSSAFRPYSYGEGDSLSEKKISPERGQLLLALTVMNLDSTSFDKIKSKATFSWADLKEADLKGVNLWGADLSGANLYAANLQGADLHEADLRGANLWGANLNQANMKEVDLKRADVRWAELNEVDLRNADLNGADLSSAKLRKADMRGAKLQWAQMEGALLNGANLAGIDLLGTGMNRVNMSGANLRKANLRQAILDRANFSEAELDKAALEEGNWLEKIDEWCVIGAKEIHLGYRIVADNPYYHLEKVGE